MRTWRSKPASTRVSSPTSLRGNSRGNRRYLLMRRHRYIARSTLRQIHLRLASELRCYLFAHVCARSLILRYCDVMIKPSQIFEKTFPCWLTRSLLDNAPRWCLRAWQGSSAEYARMRSAACTCDHYAASMTRHRTRLWNTLHTVEGLAFRKKHAYASRVLWTTSR